MPPYRTQSRDTSPEVERVIIARLRELSPLEKVEMIRNACRAAEQWTLAGLRARHPECDEAELRVLAGKQRLGPDLARRVFGAD